MTIEEMKARKRELGYTNESLARASGLPLGTVQKIFSGATKAPRLDTINALAGVLGRQDVCADKESGGRQNDRIRETAAPYYASDRPASRAAFGHGKSRNTLHEYYALPPERRAELVDGEFVDMASPGVLHQIILSELVVQLSECARQHGKDCYVLPAPFDVQLDKNEYTMLQPDLLMFCGKEHFRNNAYYGAPPFVVEILSPSSRRHDMIRKLNKYQEAGVREYWIVDPEGERVLVYAFETEIYPVIYGKNEKVPVGISDGDCIVDFKEVFERASIPAET